MNIFDMNFTFPTDVAFTTRPADADEAVAIETALMEALSHTDQARQHLHAALESLSGAGARVSYKVPTMKEVEREIWKSLLLRHPVLLFMDKKTRNNFRRNLQEGNLPPVTAESILSKMAELEAQAPYYLRNWAFYTSLIYTGRLVAAAKARGRQTVKAEEMLVPREFRIGGWRAVDWAGDYYRVLSDAQDELQELDRLVHALDGIFPPLLEEDDPFPIAKKMPLTIAVEAAGERGETQGETEYFTFRVFKARLLTASLKRKDLRHIWTQLVLDAIEGSA